MNIELRESDRIKCSRHPDAPHGFDRNASHNERRYVCLCEMVGCGHGRLYTEPCVDCEIVGLKQEYKSAVKAIERITKRMNELGISMPGIGRSFVGLELSEIDEAINGNITITDSNLRDGVYAAILDAEIMLKEKNESRESAQDDE